MPRGCGATRVARAVHEVRRARKEYQCGQFCGCRIKVGEHYLYSAIPPEHEFYRSKHWWVSRTCLRHAELFQLHTDATRKQAEELKGGDSDKQP
jgi:hypothetical protein